MEPGETGSLKSETRDLFIALSLFSTANSKNCIMIEWILCNLDFWVHVFLFLICFISFNPSQSLLYSIQNK